MGMLSWRDDSGGCISTVDALAQGMNTIQNAWFGFQVLREKGDEGQFQPKVRTKTVIVLDSTDPHAPEQRIQMSQAELQTV